MGSYPETLACEQAPHLGDIVKSTRARGEATVPRGVAARSRVLARLASLAQIGELARRLRKPQLIPIFYPD